MSQAMINSMLISVFGTLLGIAVMSFWRSRDAVIKKAAKLAEENEKLLKRVTEIETKVALVNQAIVPINTAFQAILVKELTHYHTPELDALLVKLGPPNELTPEEDARLWVMMEERTRDMGPEISDHEREAAKIFPSIVKRAREEAIVLAKADALKFGFVAVEDRRNPMGLIDLTGQRLDSDEVSATAEKSLKKIEENTAAAAESLSAVNRRAVERLADTAVKKALEVEKAKD